MRFTWISKYMNEVLEFNAEERWCGQPGLVQDVLNAFCGPRFSVGARYGQQ